MSSKNKNSSKINFLNSSFETNHVVFEPINPFLKSDAELIIKLRSRESVIF